MHNNQYRLHRRPPKHTRWSAFIRIFILLLVLATVIYLLFQLFFDRDVYVDIDDLIKDNEFEKVDKMTKKMIEENPLDIRTFRLMGKNYFLHALRVDELKKDQTEEGFTFYKKAIESFKKAILLDKKGLIDSKDYMTIGFSYMKQGEDNYEDALKYFHLAETHNTNDHNLEKSNSSFFGIATLYRLMGYIYFKSGEYRDSLKYYKKANSKSRKLLNTFYMGLCQKNLGQYRDAATDIQLVYDRSKNPLLKNSALHNLAWLHLKMNNLQYAERLYVNCVNNDTNYAEGYYWLGKIAERQGRKSEAVSNWKRSLAADPQYGPALLKMKNQ